MPAYVPGLHKRMYAAVMFRALKQKAGLIICDSFFTADELIRLTGITRERLRVVHCGVDSSWFTLPKSQRPHDAPYILFVGNVKPHKNLVRLVEAFGLLIDQIPHDLVIVGKRDGFLTPDTIVEQKAARLGTRVHFAGYVKDDLLQQYLSNAELLVLPSVYEGFGLPPLEAMALGCPVLVADIPPLREVCGDAALYCDPYSATGIASRILDLINSPDLQSELRERGALRAGQFTWEKCATQTSEAIEQLLK